MERTNVSHVTSEKKKGLGKGGGGCKEKDVEIAS